MIEIASELIVRGIVYGIGFFFLLIALQWLPGYITAVTMGLIKFNRWLNPLTQDLHRTFNKYVLGTEEVGIKCIIIEDTTLSDPVFVESDQTTIDDHDD